MRKVLEMQHSLLSASAVSVLCVPARGQMRSLKSATVCPHIFTLNPLPLCADLCTPRCDSGYGTHQQPSPWTMRMHSVSSIHPARSYRTSPASSAPPAPEGAAREGLRLLLAPCHGHSSLMTAGLQHSCHFWAGFM